jgi:glycosyltransferase involved in cell wall biosynthesis
VRVLLANHTSRISGAEHTLLDFLRARPPGVTFEVAAPVGALQERVQGLGIPFHPLRGTDAGLKLHPTRTPLALMDTVADGVMLARLARRSRAAVLHANSTRAALSAAVARRAGGPPVAVHVHDVVRDDRVSHVVRGVIARSAAVVFANSAYVARTLEPAIAGPRVVVVDNPVDLERFDRRRADGGAARRELALAAGTPVITVVGQITPWKGQDVAIRALAALPERFAAAVLLLVGEPVFTSAGTQFDNVAYQDGLRRLAQECGVADRVRFLGARDDVPDLLAATDVALVPSWEEPFGRVVIEAMAMRVPVVATNRGGPPDILRDGTGITLPPREPGPWTQAVARLLDDPRAGARMAAAAEARAHAHYGLQAYCERVIEGYRRCGAGPGPAA